MAAAQVVREVASVDARCTHHLVRKQRPFVQPLPQWREKVLETELVKNHQPMGLARVSLKQASVFKADLTDYRPNLVLLHPPYPGVIQYHLIHKLATDFLDVVNSCLAPVSLRGYDFRYDELKRSDVSTDRVREYGDFVQALAELMKALVAPGGRCVVIMGDQRYRGRVRHPFTEFISSFEESGFSLEEIFIWVLQNNSGMHIQRRGHFIDHNYIMVFEDGEE